ncbi:hypothetical protein [Sphaerospermopsis aphanizomenoides]|nr:hypothetical protein [Sphaerospermopsis aphanizomenoides]
MMLTKKSWKNFKIVAGVFSAIAFTQFSGVNTSAQAGDQFLTPD